MLRGISGMVRVGSYRVVLYFCSAALTLSALVILIFASWCRICLFCGCISITLWLAVHGSFSLFPVVTGPHCIQFWSLQERDFSLVFHWHIFSLLIRRLMQSYRLVPSSYLGVLNLELSANTFHQCHFTFCASAARSNMRSCWHQFALDNPLFRNLLSSFLDTAEMQMFLGPCSS